MNKEQFLKELAYLLQDLAGGEAEDALSYYRDYFDEAGPENEEAVLRELGSPERIAAIVRADLNGNLGNGGEFTDRGYEDERFKEPGYQISRRFDLPDARENSGRERRETARGGWESEAGRTAYSSREAGNAGKAAHDRWEPGADGRTAHSSWESQASGNGAQGRWEAKTSRETEGGRRDSGPADWTAQGGRENNTFGNTAHGGWREEAAGESAQSGRDFGPAGRTAQDRREYGGDGEHPGRKNEILTVLLLAALALVALPAALGLGSELVGIAVALVSLLFTLTLGVAGVTLALLIGGVVLIVAGCVIAIGKIMLGLMIAGCGLLSLGLGILGIALSVVFYGKALPAVLRWTADGVRRLFGGGRRCRDEKNA